MNDAFGHPQSVLVFGGTSEIALEIVDLLIADRCTTLVLSGRDAEALDASAKRLPAGRLDVAKTVEFDASTDEHVDDTVDQCFGAANGRVDLVLVAVGELGNQLQDERDSARIAQLITVNFTWPAAAIGAVAKRMQAQGSGRIVVLSSVAGVRARRSNFLYGSTKAGLDAFSQGLSESLRGTGVVLQIVRPGFVFTRMTSGMRPPPLSVGPKVVAEIVVQGLKKNKTVIWAPSPLQWLFLVLRHLPQPVWRRLPG
jgi:decaprenylphospho-beta-D-erythro-pentofuranosid-2-ulose 2-reductase